MGANRSFEYKICRSCGKEFQSDNAVCDECLLQYDQLVITLQQGEHRDYQSRCEYCGRPFIRGYMQNRKGKKFFQPTRSVYCKGIHSDGIHYSQCLNCGRSISVKLDSGWPNKVGCSRKCTAVLQKESLRRTSLLRYGTENPMQSQVIKDKTKQTCLDRYGVEYVLQKGAKRDEINAAMRKKFNVESNVSQNPEIRAKITQTFEQRHGGYTWASEELSNKCKQTCIERYGTEYYHQSPEGRQRMREIFVQRHADSIRDPVVRARYLEFVQTPIEYIKNHFKDKPTLHQVSQSLGNLDESTIYEYIGEGRSRELFSVAPSKMEEEVLEFLQRITSTSILRQDRKVIKPKEIDLYLPEFNFGIECNPTASHNSSLPFITKDTSAILPSSYHSLKSNLCQQKGIFLFHIFGYEWTHHQDIIKSMISNILGANTTKYFARNLHICEISDFESKQFLEFNHRQGYASSRIRIGLRTSDGTLVSLMTFGRPRNTMGGKKDDTSQTFELIRFCNKLNTSVVGGASKLFKYFRDHYNFDRIVSFSDIAHTRGRLYELLGFDSVGISSANYVWVNMYTDVAYNRVNCQKNNLPKLFNEPDLDIKNLTEKQIMMEHGFVQVFDSGTIRWEYTTKK